jgi:hypothetical protein
VVPARARAAERAAGARGFSWAGYRDLIIAAHRQLDAPLVWEGIWSLLKRSMANFAAADLDGLVRIVKRKLKKIQYRPHLIDGCLAATGLTIEPW